MQTGSVIKEVLASLARCRPELDTYSNDGFPFRKDAQSPVQGPESVCQLIRIGILESSVVNLLSVGPARRCSMVPLCPRLVPAPLSCHGLSGVGSQQTWTRSEGPVLRHGRFSIAGALALAGTCFQDAHSRYREKFAPLILGTPPRVALPILVDVFVSVDKTEPCWFAGLDLAVARDR
jgi:hypothetical protein